MSIETFGNNISTLNAANPTGADAKSTADDHIRGVKSVLLAQFAALTAPVTATAAELNRVAGVTSAIQTQLDAKAPTNSPALTGTPTAPTATGGTATTQIASTAFVSAAIAAVNSVTTLTPVFVTTTSQSAAVGTKYILSNVAATTVTAPASPSNDQEFAVVPANGLLTNIVDFGAATVQGPIASTTGSLTLDLGPLYVKWNTTLNKWISQI